MMMGWGDEAKGAICGCGVRGGGLQEHLCFDARMHLQEKKDRLLSVSNELLDSVDHEAEEKERLLLERSGLKAHRTHEAHSNAQTAASSSSDTLNGGLK